MDHVPNGNRVVVACVDLSVASVEDGGTAVAADIVKLFAEVKTVIAAIHKEITWSVIVKSRGGWCRRQYFFCSNF